MLTLPTKTLREVTCYHCLQPFQASSHAITLTCPHCYKRVSLQDLIVHGIHHHKSVETAGIVVIERKGWLRSPNVRVVEGIEVHGRVEADVTCDGPVVLGPKAHWHGNLTAPALLVSAGAVITGGFFRIGPAKGT